MDTPNILGQVRELLDSIAGEAGLRLVGAPRTWGPMHAIAVVEILARTHRSRPTDEYRRAFNEVALALGIDTRKEG